MNPGVAREEDGGGVGAHPRECYGLDEELVLVIVFDRDRGRATEICVDREVGDVLDLVGYDVHLLGPVMKGSFATPLSKPSLWIILKTI